MTMRIATIALMLLSAACATSGRLDKDGKKTLISVKENAGSPLLPVETPGRASR